MIWLKLNTLAKNLAANAAVVRQATGTGDCPNQSLVNGKANYEEEN